MASDPLARRSNSALMVLILAALVAFLATACATPDTTEVPTRPATTAGASDASPAAPKDVKQATAPATPTADSTATAIAWHAEGTRLAAPAATALAAGATPVIAGPLRTAGGDREAWVEIWPCPSDADQQATAAAAGGDWSIVLGYERLMAQVEGQDPVLVDSQTMSCGGLGAYGLEGRRWSPDGQLLYYTQARDGGPDGLSCGCCPELTAWDSRDGSTAGGFIPSPLGGQVARTVDGLDGTTELEVADTNLAAVRRFPLPEQGQNVGYPNWSPDETWVAFQVGCGDAPSGALAVRLGDGHVLHWDTSDPEQPVINVAWDPDGKALRIESFRSAWRWDLEADRVEPVATP